MLDNRLAASERAGNCCHTTLGNREHGINNTLSCYQRFSWRKFLLIWTATSYRPVLHQGQLFIAVCCGKNCNGLIHGKLAGFNFLQSTFHIGRYHDLLCNNDSLLNGSKNIAALQRISHLRNRNEIPFFVPLQGRNLNASFQVVAACYLHDVIQRTLYSIVNACNKARTKLHGKGHLHGLYRFSRTKS